MNISVLQKNQHKTARLRPHVRGPHGEPMDDDWTFVVDLAADTVTVTNVRTSGQLPLGSDVLEGWDSDAKRGPNFGFLKLHHHVFMDASGELNRTGNLGGRVS
jgi:hypothetical protein